MKIFMKDNKINIKMNVFDMGKIIEDYSAKIPENSTHLVDIKTSNDINFYGGTFQDFLDLPKMEPFIESKKRVEDLKIMSKIQSRIGYLPKRRRETSEHDGEWDWDRRFDIKPFNRAYKKPSPNRIIDINCDLSISCAVKPQDINDYGCLVWAISQYLEELGYCVNVNIFENVRNVYKTGEGMRMDLVVKNSSEYISPQLLAKAFRSVTFRRGMFCMSILAGDKFEKTAERNLGTPWEERQKKIEFAEGKLWLKSGVQANYAEVETEIFKIVNGG